MKKILFVLCLISALLSASVPVSAQGEPPKSDYQPLGIHPSTLVEFPKEPLGLGFLKGTAKVLITVDAEGKLKDALPIAYTHPSFAESAKEALGNGTFDPARRNGQPITVTVELEMNFEKPGPVVVPQTSVENARASMRRASPNYFNYRAYTLKEIDRKLVPRGDLKVPHPKDLVARASNRTVTLEYYVDETGRVRMPVALEGADPALASWAADAVKQWRFAPPTRNGRPVLVRVRQDIEFGEPKGSPAQPV